MGALFLVFVSCEVVGGVTKSCLDLEDLERARRGSPRLSPCSKTQALQIVLLDTR